MFTLVTTRPVASSICDGTPTPIARGGPSRRVSSVTPASIAAITFCAVVSGVGCSTDATTSRPTTWPTATLVPPTSTPTMAPSRLSGMAPIFPIWRRRHGFGINARDGQASGPEEHPHRPDRGRDLPVRLRGRLLRRRGLLMAAEPGTRADALTEATEQVHMPEPSYLPVVVALGVTLMLVGVVLAWFITIIGAVPFVVGTVLWIRETRADIAQLPLDHS